nr:MAG TPA: hypothetical protein [Caudoviricetes sp.]
MTVINFLIFDLYVYHVFHYKLLINPVRVQNLLILAFYHAKIVQFRTIIHF